MLSLRFMVTFLLLVVLVPLFETLAAAWKELKSPSTQPLTSIVTERSREDTRRRSVPVQVSRANSLWPRRAFQTIFRKSVHVRYAPENPKPESSRPPARPTRL
jgi:hypothetical protein